MPFREEYADIVGHVFQAARGPPHIVGGAVPVRSGHTHVRVPPVPELVGELVEADPIELAIAFEATGHMPTLAADIFDQPCGGVPTVELDIDAPPSGQERAQGRQHQPGQGVLAAKGQALLWRTAAIEPPHGLFPQVQPQVDGHGERADAHGALQVAKAILEARLVLGAFAVIVKPIDRFQMPRVLVFLAQRVVDVDVDDLGRPEVLRLGQRPGHLVDTQGGTHVFGGPGADAQKIGRVGGIGGVQELPLERRQGLLVFAHQQRIGHIEDVAALRLREVEVQLVEKGA